MLFGKFDRTALAGASFAPVEVPLLDADFDGDDVAQKIGSGKGAGRSVGKRKSGWHRARVPFSRRRGPDLPKSRELTAGPVRRIDPREPWPADDLAQVARRNGVTGKELLSMLDAQGHRCALCGGEFKPWGLAPRLADESPGELVCVGCLTRLRLAGGAYWERETRYVG